MEEELRFQVVIDETLERKIQGAVAFGFFETEDPNTVIYPSDAAPQFYRDLILGRPLPLVFVTRRIENLGVLLSFTLFLHRDLALHPEVANLMTSMYLVDTCAEAGLAHVDRDLSRFLRFLQRYLGVIQSKREQQESLPLLVGWIRNYLLEGALPALPPEKELPRVIDRGTDGFVFASIAHDDLSCGWEELFRMGFLRGILVHSDGFDRWKVLCRAKSTYLAYDLTKAASILNEMEAAMGEPEGWHVRDGVSLSSRKAGTLILPTDLLQVLVRV